MKVLQLCHKPPLPAKDGGCIAMNNLTKGLLKQEHQVKIIAMTTHKHPVNLSDLPNNYRQETGIETVFINTKINLFDAIKTSLFNQSYYVKRFVSKEFERKIIDILKKDNYEVVVLESIFVAPYIATVRQYSKAKIILRAHNIEFKIWERLAQKKVGIFKKIAFSILASKLKRYEMSVFHQIDGYMAISQQDYDFFHEKFADIEGIVLPFGIDLDEYDHDEEYIPSLNPKLFHIGSLAWKPNLEGIEWFFEEIWPHIHEAFPTLTFTLAGREIPEKIKMATLPNVNIMGEVDDATAFMMDNDIMVVPILSGSGVRVKIIEGMAMGKTIITTEMGAEGLEVENEKHLFIANTADDFVQAIGRCIKTPDICTFIGEKARNFVFLHHNNDLISKKMNDFLKLLT